MEFLKTIGKAVGEAAAHLGEKNHRAAQLSRIRSFIRCQEKAAEKEYLALGRYYYHNLRDKENDVTEAHCLALDEIEQRLDAALDQLSQCYSAGEAREEVTLEDVQAFDQDPAAQEETPAQGAPARWRQPPRRRPPPPRPPRRKKTRICPLRAKPWRNNRECRPR